MEEKQAILVVDDSRMSRKILGDIFQAEYEILEANDGIEAIKVLEKNHTNIVLMLLDINMPRMDGFGVLEYLKNKKNDFRIPVVVNTQHGEVENELQALDLGARDFITKPYHPEIVRRRVDNVLAGVHMQRDTLTGLYTRTAFCKKTEQMLRENKETEYVFVCCNLERFQVVNDLFGTQTGDRILTGIAAWLSMSIRDKGVYGRIEGDKFAACIPKEYFDADITVTKMQRLLHQLLPNYKLTGTLGIYPVNDIEVPANHMFDRAVLAMRTVKGNYLKRYAYYDADLREVILKEQDIINQMAEALEAGNFHPYLQPIYDVKTEKPVSAEALIRWIHPEKGMLMPNDFIPLFERNGFISKVDAYMWECICQFLAECKQRGDKLLPISVNVSRIDFYNPHLCDIFMGLIEKYQIDPYLLCIEVTESAYMDNPQQLIENMHALQQKGFQVMIDDFGSGYSSLNMLKNVSANVLKVDMQFLDDLESSTRAASIVNCVIQLAKQLGMGIVVEGVETVAQIKALKDMECGKVQGYYYSRPMCMQDYRKLVNQECE